MLPPFPWLTIRTSRALHHKPPTVKTDAVISLEVKVFVVALRGADESGLRKVNESMFEDLHVEHQDDGSGQRDAVNRGKYAAEGRSQDVHGPVKSRHLPEKRP